MLLVGVPEANVNVGVAGTDTVLPTVPPEAISAVIQKNLSPIAQACVSPVKLTVPPLAILVAVTVLKADPPGNTLVAAVYNLKFVISPVTNVPPAVKDKLFSVAFEVDTFTLKLESKLSVDDLATLPEVV